MRERTLYFGGLIGLIIVVGLVYSFFIRPQYYRFNGGQAYLEIVSSERFTSEYIQTTVIGEDVFILSKDGLLKKDIDGNTIWTKVFALDAPYMVNSGNYLAVGDITGKEAFVFNVDGFLYSVKESWPLTDVDINQNGYFITVTEKDEQNFITYYNNKGEKLIGRGTLFIEDGYPIAVSTSPDVEQMVTAYVDVSNSRIQTRLSFFDFDEQYDSYDEQILADDVIEDMIPIDSYWMNDTTVVAIMDGLINTYKTEGIPQELGSIEINSKLINVCTTNEQIIVQYGDPINQSENDLSNSVCVYDYEGKLLVQHTYDQEVLTIDSNESNYFVFTSDTVIKYIGKNREWFASRTYDMSHVFELNKTSYLFVSDSGYELMKISAR